MSYLGITDTCQGITRDDRRYGYCGIPGRGGVYFTHYPSLAETLASIDDDATDPPRDWPRRAYQEVRGYIRREWAAGRIGPRR